MTPAGRPSPEYVLVRMSDLKYIAAQAGIPDPVEACRAIIRTVERIAAAPPVPVTPVVYCVICIEPGESETLHIFSTPEKRQAFMDADERGHVAYDYTVDAPERHEEPISDH